MTRFLRELRQLRNGAGLGHAELAARAHYPYDLIKAAEAGPGLPDLPVLSAFVRGCGGTTEEWEERWRSLTNAPSLPLATARLVGRGSDAADAGARLGASTPAGDAPDPSAIMAALDRVADEMAGTSESLARASRETSAPAAENAPAPPNAGSTGSAGGWGAPSRSAWDPIRMSSAWPVLREDNDDAAAEAVKPPWESESWDDAPTWGGEKAGPTSAVPAFPDLSPPPPTTANPLPGRAPTTGHAPPTPVNPLPPRTKNDSVSTASTPLPKLPVPGAPKAGAASTSGPMPSATSGPMSSATSGPMPSATSGPMPSATSGPMSSATSGPQPSAPAAGPPTVRTPVHSGPIPSVPTTGGPAVGGYPASGTLATGGGKRSSSKTAAIVAVIAVIILIIVLMVAFG